jgi:EmrB/QacA subfamily drug resistance transporter
MRKWLPLVAICLGAFILLVDVTIVNVALPSMASDLNASFSSLQWVMDVYALALAALLMVAGSLADLFGHRRLYVAGLTVFALASLAAALSPNAVALISARAVQGVGGAAMYATSAALVASTYHGRDRGTAFGVWGAVNGAAAAAGPVLGGLLTEGFGWQAIFLVKVLPAGRRGTTRIDLPGAFTFTLAAAALTYALIRGGEHGWTDSLTLAAFVVALVAAVAFVVVEARSAHPMLDLALLRRATFSGLLGGALLYQAAAFSGLVYISLWLQNVLGLSPIRGGLALMPLAGASFLAAALAGRFMHGIPPRLPISGGLLLIAAGSAVLWRSVHASSGQTSLFVGFALIGVGVGFATPVLVSAAVDSLPPQRAGMAGGAVNTFRQLGMTLGIALFGAIFTSRLRAVTSGGGSVRAGYASALDRLSLAAAIAGLAGAVLIFCTVRRPAPTVPTPAASAADSPTQQPAPSTS